MRPPAASLSSLLCALALASGSLSAQVSFNDYDQPPHNYYDGEPQDPASVLKRQIASGEKQPDLSSQIDYFRWLIQELSVPAESQTVVFSKTGLQRKVVSPHNSRALYFNDQTFITFIPGGMTEIASYDPLRGPIFYILEGSETSPPAPAVRFNKRESCLVGCHAGSATNYLPGLLARSLYVDAMGNPMNVDAAGIVVNAISLHENMAHTMPIKERWGGWFVTGSPANADHIGNILFQVRGGPPSPAPALAAQEKLLPHGSSSDVLPLLVQDHQIGLLNQLYEVFYRWRTRLHLDNEKRKAAGQPELAQLDAAGVEYLGEHLEKLAGLFLFSGEAPLPAGGIKGDPAFITAFSRGKKTDGQGRSLRDLELKSHLLRHRCSHMIHSPQFEGMPAAFRSLVLGRICEVLKSPATTAGYEHLQEAERQAIHEILLATIPQYRGDAAMR